MSGTRMVALSCFLFELSPLYDLKVGNLHISFHLLLRYLMYHLACVMA